MNIQEKLEKDYIASVPTNCPYDYTAVSGTHYLELKERRIPSTKYCDIVADHVKVNQLLKLDKPTMLLCTFTDGKVFKAMLTVLNSDGEIELGSKVQTIKKSCRKTTDFHSNGRVDKILYSILIKDCQEVV